MRVLFLHGLESGPGGSKVEHLRASFEVVAPHLPTDEAKRARTTTALEPAIGVALRLLEGIDVAVGSSFGGAVLAEMMERGLWNGPAILLCPAWRRFTQKERLTAPNQKVVVHAADDDIVPVEDSILLGDAVILPDGGHRLPNILQGDPSLLVRWVHDVAHRHRAGPT